MSDPKNSGKLNVLLTKLMEFPMRFHVKFPNLRKTFLAKIGMGNFQKEIVGSKDQESSQQLQTWFSEHFFTPKLVALFVTRVVSVTELQILREKMSKEPCSIRL